MPLIRKSGGGSAAPPPDAAATLHALANGTEDERWAAARAAAELPGSVAALGQALTRETSFRVREALFTALARIATPQSVEAVLPLLRADDSQVRTGAVDALAAMKDVAWPYIAALTKDQNPHVRVLACELTRDMPAEQAGPVFCAVLDSELDPNVCATAVDALSEIGRAEALPALTRCAQRFHTNSFLTFAIETAVHRIRSHTA